MASLQQQVPRPELVFKPQNGKQTEFLACNADIVIYGGAAGSGKTYALLLEALRFHQRPYSRIAIFRRERTRSTNPGGLWDEAKKMFPYFAGESNEQKLAFTFPSRATISFLALQHENDVKKYHGAQIPVILFDEITEFTEYQFFYMLSRNRSDSGIAGYVRGTCNPDSSSWVRGLIDWWIGTDGLPIQARSGVIRYFARVNDTLFWGDSKQQLIDEHGVKDIDCKSFTFIPATIEDNQILLQNDPRYVSNLRALNEVEKQRLLFGNWNIKVEGKLFKQEDFMVFTRNPAVYKRKVIIVDAANKTKQANDYTVMQCWVLSDKGIYLIDQVRGKFTFPDLETSFTSFINKHTDAEIYIEDAVNGTALLQTVKRKVRNRIFNAILRNKDKYQRAFDCQGFVKEGYVFINVMMDYYNDFIAEVTAFNGDGKTHDDQVDCMLDAILKLLIEPARVGNRDDKPELNRQIF